MTFNNSTVLMIIIVAFAFYLIYSQNQQQIIPHVSTFKQVANNTTPPCPKCEMLKLQLSERETSAHPQITNVVVDHDTDPYSDPIKKQDSYSMYDHLTYPQLRLPREILQKYNEYYERNGSYPPFGQATQPLFDNPVLNGLLFKEVDDNEPFTDNIPSSIPLFRVKSSKNTNRFFYYIIDQRYFSKLELKIPLDNVKINGIRYNNADFYGLPEIYDGDIIENIPSYPGAKFKVMLYKTFHFP